jgi:hypothetical protein
VSWPEVLRDLRPGSASSSRPGNSSAGHDHTPPPGGLIGMARMMATAGREREIGVHYWRRSVFCWPRRWRPPPRAVEVPEQGLADCDAKAAPRPGARSDRRPGVMGAPRCVPAWSKDAVNQEVVPVEDGRAPDSIPPDAPAGESAYNGRAGDTCCIRSSTTPDLPGRQRQSHAGADRSPLSGLSGAAAPTGAADRRGPESARLQ